MKKIILLIFVLFMLVGCNEKRVYIECDPVYCINRCVYYYDDTENTVGFCEAKAKKYKCICASRCRGNDHENIRSCVIRYGRGLRHEACHAIDLCNYLFGKAIDYIKQQGGQDALQKRYENN